MDPVTMLWQACIMPSFLRQPQRLFAIRALIIIQLCLIVWISDFYFCQHLGLYEDDYYHIAPSFQWNFDVIEYLAKTIFTSASNHGRPLGLLFGSAASWVGFHLMGGLAGTYVLGYLIVALNAGLAYILFERLGGVYFACVAGLAFVLFPADTTQAFLTHSLILQPSLTLLLAALNLYVSRHILWKALSYLFVVALMLTYELSLPIFAAAPILAELHRWQVDPAVRRTSPDHDSDQDIGQYDEAEILLWRKKFIRKMAGHWGIMALLCLGIVIYRKLIGDARVAEDVFANYPISDAVQNMVIGPVVSLFQYPWRMLQTAGQLEALRQVANLSLVLAVVFLGCFIVVTLARRLTPTPATSTSHPKRQFVALLITGYGMLCLSYGFSFSLSGWVVAGRFSRVHSAAAIGAAMVIGAMVCLVARSRFWQRFRVIPWLFCSGLALGLTLLTAFGLTIQLDYIASWTQQKQVLASIVALAPDFTDGTHIFVEGVATWDDEKQVLLNSVSLVPSSNNDGYILAETADPKGDYAAQFIERVTMAHVWSPGYFYQTPPEWGQPPRVWFVPPDWLTSEATISGGLLSWPTYALFWEYDEVRVDPKTAILLRYADGEWERVEQAAGLQFKPAPALGTQPAFAPTPIQQLVLADPAMHIPALTP